MGQVRESTTEEWQQLVRDMTAIIEKLQERIDRCNTFLFLSIILNVGLAWALFRLIGQIG